MSSADLLLVVSPVLNEGRHLERVAGAMAAQTRPPDRWIVVDDGSSDDTVAIAERWCRRLPFMTVVRAPQHPTGSRGDGLALAKEARAFNHGLRVADWEAFSHIGKLDGDIELPPTWFETLLARFSAEPRLGVAGGRLEDLSPTGWELNLIPDFHVHGGVKLYRCECLKAIGGIREQLAWDTIDETYARMLGYRSHSFAELVARHHRRSGSAQGWLRGRARHGECAWIVHYSLPWILLRSVKLACLPPRGLSGVAFAYGFARAAARGTPRVADPRFRRFVRGELRGRLHGALKR